ncbi:MAG: cobalt-precorrin-6A reductase, partial [Rhodospirillales bacterium CG15_BIG_FIL_POST_REV_8_21_14_020_66_15]
GDASRAKVDAALDLGISVILIDPPPPPPPPRAETVEVALAWLDRL